ncbi:MAG TPA: LLM class flavin-dependent oxidoreductase [Solirubrobacteraceae bacterium]|jgi:alkanesulfonate monooxygenase SsuD/methylene tetrahydromethanopterin reductase-like flavin-dependent oxidoreductase (luciferase family)|nr:LLM class flavin-dependent oxidoreductase [Solirubrobacteraceae bacterium]
MELGLATFADVPLGAEPPQVAQRLRELLEEIELADRLGLEVFGLGEHHRPDYAVSVPPIALAAAAARTERIRLSSAVTVLSSSDPVRVFEDFATLDLISGGRAEIMAGRGSFTESFPLFGLNLDDYDELFAEKLELLLALRSSERVNWSGRHRPALEDAVVYPRPLQHPLPVWIAVGGTPASVARAGLLGLPLMIAIIGGPPARFAPLVELYRQAVAQGAAAAGPGPADSDDADARDAIAAPTPGPAGPAVGINSHTYVAATSQRARDEFFPAYSQVMNRIGRERGWPPMARAQFDAACGPDGHLLVGTAEEVAEKIVAEHALFSHDRFLAHISIGTLPHAKAMHAIELFGTEVAPAVRAALAPAAAAP